MCILEAASKSMGTGASYLVAGAQTIVTTAKQVPLFLNRHFVDLTNKVLPSSIAKFTQEAVYALPITVGIHTLPSNVVTAACLAYVLTTVVIGKISDSSANTIWTGLRNSYAFNAARSIVEYSQSAQAVSANLAISNILCVWLTNLLITTPVNEEMDEVSEEISGAIG
jgi:hypothetical protein